MGKKKRPKKGQNKESTIKLITALIIMTTALIGLIDKLIETLK